MSSVPPPFVIPSVVEESLRPWPLWRKAPIDEISPRASLGRHDKGRRGDGRNDNESINLKN